MTTALWCVLIAGLLPYLATITAKAGAKFDNNHPRDWLAKQEGYRRRANAAQANAFEALPFFAAAVIIAHMLHGPQPRADLFAMCFIVARLVYFAAYLADWATARSIAWLAGMVIIAMFFFAL